jgi:hypothetical protein
VRGSHRKGVLRLGNHDRLVAVILPGQGTLFILPPLHAPYLVGESRLRPMCPPRCSPAWTLPRPPRSATSPSATPASRPPSRGSYRVVEDTMTIAGKPSATRSFARVGSLCGPRPVQVRQPPPGPPSWSGPPTTSSGSPAAWAVATTRPSTRSRRAWRPSPAAVGSPPCCAPKSASTSAARRPWPGGSTRPRCSASRPPTAGMRC